MKPFEGVHHPPFLSVLNYIHYTFHGAKFMPFIQEVLGEFRFFTHIAVIVLVFAEPYVKRPSGLANILFVARRAAELIYSTFLIFISLY